MIRPLVRRALAGTATAATLVVLLAGSAGAHVDPTPAAVEAGTSSTVSFGLEHGCDDSGVVKVEIEIPDGVTDVTPAPAPAGWSGTVADGVVTFVGGPQDPHEGIDFAIDATFPDTPDASVSFPTVQTCEVGSVSWIDPVVAGQEEPEHPAPTMLLTAAPPTEEQLAPAEEDGEDGEDGKADAGHGETAITTTSESAAESEESDSSNTALILGVVAVVVVLGAVGGVLVSRRRSQG